VYRVYNSSRKGIRHRGWYQYRLYASTDYRSTVLTQTTLLLHYRVLILRGFTLVLAYRQEPSFTWHLGYNFAKADRYSHVPALPAPLQLTLALQPKYTVPILSYCF
jgi:hypothetical protein